MTEKRKETLDVLLHEMSEMREYERSFFAQFGVIISIVALLLAAIPAILERFPEMPVWVYIVAPIVPSSLVAYAALISMLQMLRGRYTRTLELRLHKLTAQDGDVLPIPSWDHLQMEVTAHTHSQWYAQANWFLLYLVVALMLAGAAYFSESRISDVRLLVIALVVNVICIGLPTFTLGWVLSQGMESWKDTLANLEESLTRTRREFQNPSRGKTEQSERALLSYLLLPRNQEELLKGLFLPICFAIGSWLLLGTVPWKSPYIGHLVGFFFVFEILMYQGRYLLNDVKDRGIDSTSGISKIRFPRSWVFSDDGRDLLSSTRPREKARASFALYAACASFIGRFVLAILLVACLFPIDSVRHYRWVEDAIFVIGIFAFATAYETARSQCSFARDEFNGKHLRFWTSMTVLLVGLGYGLRSAAGIWAAGVRGPVLLAIFVGGSLFGSSFVALTWAIESTRAGVDDLGKGKGYLIPFRNSLRKLPQFFEREPVIDEPPLQGVQRIRSYWSFYPVLATCALAVFVFYALRLRAPAIAYGLVMLVMLAGTLIAVRSRVHATVAISVIGFLVSAYLLHKQSIPVVNSLVGSAIIFLPLGTTCVFRRLCYKDLPGVIHKIGLFLLLGPRSFYLWFEAKRETPNAENPYISSSGAEQVVRPQAAAGSDSR